MERETRLVKLLRRVYRVFDERLDRMIGSEGNGALRTSSGRTSVFRPSRT